MLTAGRGPLDRWLVRKNSESAPKSNPTRSPPPSVASRSPSPPATVLLPSPPPPATLPSPSPPPSAALGDVPPSLSVALCDVPPSPPLDFEAARLANIRRNNELLARLGLASTAATVTAAGASPATASKAKPKQPKKRVRDNDDSGDLFVRRSSRLQQIPPSSATTAASTSESVEPAAPRRPPSPVMLGTPLPNVAGSACDVFAAPDELLESGLCQCACSGHNHAVYSTSVHDDLLAVAGGMGFVSLYRTSSTPSSSLVREPLLACKLHARWVSEVTFYDPTTLLSSADDGYLIVSRLEKDNTELVPLSRGRVHDDAKAGLFSLSLEPSTGRVATASKNGTVAITNVRSSALAVEQVMDVSDSVLKCVRWRDPHTFGACGNDRALRLFDTRTSSVAIEMLDIHTKACSALGFAPHSDHTLFTSSLDHTIKLHDLRQPATPLFTFAEHDRRGQQGSLTSPVFHRNGASLIAIGAGTPALHAYDTQTGVLASRVYLGFTPTSLAVVPDVPQRIVAAQTKAFVWVLDAKMLD